MTHTNIIPETSKPQYKIIISDEVYQKVMYWVRKAKFEVSGFGKVIRKDATTFEVVEAYLTKQEGKPTETDLDAAALGKLMYQTKDEPGELKWWWHSHVDMNVFWSATDKQTIRDLGSNGWIIATVFNTHCDTRSALCYKVESEFGISNNFIDEIDFEVEDLLDPEKCKAWDKIYDENVTEVTYSKADLMAWGKENLGGYKPISLGPSGASLIGTEDDDDTPLTKEEESTALEQMWMEEDPGLINFGIFEEAKALGMTPAAYFSIINGRDMPRIKKLEEKLVRLFNNGKFRNTDIANLPHVKIQSQLGVKN